MCSCRSGHRPSSLSTDSTARYFDRDPMTPSNPAAASRAARALPAGPVPPRMPIRTPGTVARPAGASSDLQASVLFGFVGVGGIGDGELVAHGLPHRALDLVPAGVEIAPANRCRQLPLTRVAKRPEAGDVGLGLGWSEYRFPLQHRQDLACHSGVEADPALGRRHHISFEE